jgi:hypothetical protein
MTSPVLNMTLYNPIGNLTFKAFKTHEEFDSYIRSPNFGSPEHPGICFGFDIQEFSNNTYNLNIMMHDEAPWRALER